MKNIKGCYFIINKTKSLEINKINLFVNEA